MPSSHRRVIWLEVASGRSSVWSISCATSRGTCRRACSGGLNSVDDIAKSLSPRCGKFPAIALLLGSGREDADLRQVAILLVEIHAVTHHEIIFNGKAHVICREWLDPARRLI